MIIKRMTATFGKLTNETIELAGGLNIVEMPNEGGKTTWCAFIRTMLYGPKSGERGHAADKVRWIPWSGAPMEGTMEAEHGGVYYTLSRRSRGGSFMGDCETVITGTADRIPELSGKSPGDALIGAPESVFRRSAFIRRPAIAVDSDFELERKISSLVSAGDERDSFGEADARLAKKHRRIRNRQGGELPEAEARAAELEKTLSRIGEASLEQARISAEIEAYRAAADEMRENIAQRELWEKKKKAQRWAAASEMERVKEKALSDAKAALCISGREITQADTALAADASERLSAALLRQTEAEKALGSLSVGPGGSKKLWLISLCAFAAFAILAVIFTVTEPTAAALALFAAAALCAAVAVYGIIASKRAREKTKNIMQRAENALEEATRAVDSARAEYDSRLAFIGGDEARAKALLDCAAAAEREYAAAKNNAAALYYLRDDEALVSSAVEPEGKTATREMLERTTERISVLSRELAVAQGEVKHLSDPAVIASELELTRQLVRELTLEEDAVSAARAALSEAAALMRSRFSPIVSAAAGEYLSAMTGGRYPAIFFDREMRFETRRRDEAVPRPSVLLSEGTEDQMYLAVRLAISQLVLGGPEPCPLILDGVLDSFDDERASLALKLLKSIAEKRQVILFTCHTREKRLLSELV